MVLSFHSHRQSNPCAPTASLPYQANGIGTDVQVFSMMQQQLKKSKLKFHFQNIFTRFQICFTLFYQKCQIVHL